MDIKKLSDLVIKILASRQDNLGKFDVDKDLPQNSFHLIHGLIHVINVTVDHLNQLVSNEKSKWVDWVKTGLTYNNELTFQLKYDDYQTLPVDFFNNYSIKLINTNGKQIWLFNEKAITFQQVYQCHADSIIVIQKNQLITEYSRDYCQANNIKLIERY